MFFCQIFLDWNLSLQVKNGKEYPINWIKISGDKKEDYEYDFSYYHHQYSEDDNLDQSDNDYHHNHSDLLEGTPHSLLEKPLQSRTPGSN